MPTADTFQAALSTGVVVFDGAMGTEIYRRNVLVNQCFDELCLSDPGLIRQIHASYCEAGADVLTTNSFGANRSALAKFGLAEKTEAINRAAAALARETAAVADRRVFVAGSVGPFWSGGGVAEALAVALEQVGYLVDAGVDLVLFETQPTRRSVELCAEAMAAWPEMPFVVSCAVFEDGESAAGESVERLLAPLDAPLRSPAAWGLNCGTGPDALLSAAERAVRVTTLPIIVQPNAGRPREVGGRHIYFCSPDYLAGYAKRYLDLGIRGIGGCCGTTPDHIREVAQRVKPLARKPAAAPRVELTPGVTAKEATPFAEKSRLAWRLANGHWVVSVELIPPRGYDLTAMIAKAKTLHRHGVDAINIPDGPRASSRLSPLVTALELQREAQIEAVLHFCCRDRNLIGMQADLLACAACDIRNLLFVTGDPPKLGNYPFASGVFDMDSIGLCNVQKWLNQGIDLGGQPIDPQTHAVIGVGADPTALDQERETQRFHEKAAAGAEFAMTQPVFDPDALRRFLDRVQACGIPVLAGVWPLASYRNALFLKNEVPGVVMPDAVLERMAGFSSAEDQRRAGIELARAMVAAVRDRVAGIQISPPFGNVQTALAVAE